MPERFRAFSFVDRITLKAGELAEGRFAVPAIIARFPYCLVAESVGQLASWVSMARLDFRKRPVAALAGEARFLCPVAPGQVLDLAIEMESCDDDAVAYHGWANVNGARVFELEHCIGPMLPQEEFDSPDALRRDFELLCGPGAPAGRFQGLATPKVVVSDRVPGESLRATMHVPESAPFFSDHFPRRAVFPATLLLDAQIGLALELARPVLPRRPGQELAPARVIDAKIRSWILPGQDVEIRTDLLPISGEIATATLAAYVDGKPVSTGRVEIVARETS
jgi:3-hydroxymyristoyl/3-hydroxydecanoyl-(acyl carrier protein) dehydratase